VLTAYRVRGVLPNGANQQMGFSVDDPPFRDFPARESTPSHSDPIRGRRHPTVETHRATTIDFAGTRDKRRLNRSSRHFPFGCRQKST
jgi:hypothetical protein